MRPDDTVSNLRASRALAGLDDSIRPRCTGPCVEAYRTVRLRPSHFAKLAGACVPAPTSFAPRRSASAPTHALAAPQRHAARVAEGKRLVAAADLLRDDRGLPAEGDARPLHLDPIALGDLERLRVDVEVGT